MDNNGEYLEWLAEELGLGSLAPEALSPGDHIVAVSDLESDGDASIVMGMFGTIKEVQQGGFKIDFEQLDIRRCRVLAPPSFPTHSEGLRMLSTNVVIQAIST